MPVYIRKSQLIDAPSESFYEDNRDKHEFISDPDLWKDMLPQPYRRIDRILQDILEDAWRTVEKREEEKNIELGKPRPKLIGKLAELEDFFDINCMCVSCDDCASLVFLGSHSSLIALDTDSLSLRDKISLENHSQTIRSISCAEIKKSSFFVSVITDTGNLHMYVYAFGALYPCQSLCENEIERRISFVKCEASEKADYLAVLIEPRTNSNEQLCIEVYKFTRDSWYQQLQALNDKNNASKLADATIEHANDNFISNEPAPTVFTRPAFFYQIKPPANIGKVQTQLTPNLPYLMKATDNTDIIGLGVNHFYSKSHLDLKTQLFEKTFNVQANENPFALDSKGIQFKFFYANRTLPFCSTDKGFLDDIPNSLQVCWYECNQMIFYSFTKIPKDCETRIDYCIPFTSEITHIETTKQNTLMAIALRNNNVIVYDLNSTVSRKCVHIDTGKIKSIRFLPFADDTNRSNYNDFKNRITTECVCLGDDGRIFLIDCTLLNKDEARIIHTPKFANGDDKFCYLTTCKYFPKLILVVGVTRKMYLLDTSNGSLVCELGICPVDLELLDQSIYVASKSRNIFIRSIEVNPQEAKLYVQSLNDLTQLKSYQKGDESGTFLSKSYIPNLIVDQRMRILMKERINEQINRRERLANMWINLCDRKN